MTARSYHGCTAVREVRVKSIGGWRLLQVSPVVLANDRRCSHIRAYTQLGTHSVVEAGARHQAGCVRYTAGVASPKHTHSGVSGGVGSTSGI